VYGNITIEKLIPLVEKGQMALIDVRSPAEFQNFTIPGSINIPIFTDEERAEIGTLYTQIGDAVARDRGLEIVSGKLSEFIRQFKEIEGEKTVFCWRGGMRSRTTATLLDLMNIRVYKLEGGIRAYRKWVVSQLEQISLPEKSFLLHGKTGSGKTKIIRELEKDGYPALDLEKMANHRGSIFGHIGKNPYNQKKFEALLLQRLRELVGAPYLIFEAESSKIGKVTLPPCMLRQKEKSQTIVIELPLEERIRAILEDYRPWEHQEECLEAFRRIKERIHTPIAKEIERALLDEKYTEAVQYLLEYYYDRRYKGISREFPEGQVLVVKANTVEEAARRVKEILPEKVRQW
jgi:tRNA 2-selenouridine synthase